MKKLMMITAEIMSYDMLVDALFDNLLEYRTSESKQKMLDQIEIGCHMICLKSSIDKVGGIENFNKRMDDLERKDNFFKPSEQ
jgi:hypothetical protein